MSSRKSTTVPAPSTSASPAGATSSAGSASPAVGQRQPEGTRETVEHIVIAFILAFVFKTFQAEAYVIPTGSMAPTLYGRHKEVVCSACNFRYTIGASQEIDQESGVLISGGRIRSSFCTNCRHEDEAREAPAFNGDRILVNKQVREFNRFDVVVFKNPEEPHVNYIKRLVGLPGETVRLRRGDVYARKHGTETWQIQRKADPARQKDIQLNVYDDRFPPLPLVAAGGGERWVPASLDLTQQSDKSIDLSAPSPAIWKPTENAWKADRAARVYSVEAADDQPHWLRYRHLVPSQSEWRQVEREQKLDRPVQASLVLDYCGFNEDGFRRDMVDREMYWVPDLTINATVEIVSVTEKSRLTFELTEGDRWYQCELHPMSGDVECYVSSPSAGTRVLKGQGKTEIQGPGTWTVSFANVDKRLCLWIDGQHIDLGSGVLFDEVSAVEPENADLTPAGISAVGVSAKVSELILQRDIYYRNDTILFRDGHGTTPRPGSWAEGRNHVSEIAPEGISSLSDSSRFPEVYARRYAELFGRQAEQYGDLGDYVLDDDEFLMFGDNSPASKDSRLFDYYGRPMRGVQSHRHAVRRKDLIGEALWIWWPHGVPFLNNGRGFSLMNHREADAQGRIARGDYPMFRVPFYPDFSRMKKIR